MVNICESVIKIVTSNKRKWEYNPPITIKPPHKNAYNAGYFISETATNYLSTYCLTRWLGPPQPTPSHIC